MFFKKMLSKMKNFVVIKYRTDSVLDNLKVKITNASSLKKLDNVFKNRNTIDFSKIYLNRSL